MDVLSEVVRDGVVERRFDLKVPTPSGPQVVPGCLWLPEAAKGPRAKVLFGHGGTQHKKVAHIRSYAATYAREHGWASVAIDAPGHGDRVAPEDRATSLEQLRERMATERTTGDAAQALLGRGAQAVAEWVAVLDAVEALPEVGTGATGYWGVSMGTAFGVPFLAAEPRITAATLGLFGLQPGTDSLKAAAESITIPLLFLFQWGDELVGHDAGVALYDAFGSSTKTMHVNTGPHVGIPAWEAAETLSFFERHLL